MKLSEAIRKGSEGLEQCKGDYQEGEAVCALGAAYHWLTGRMPYEENEVLRKHQYVTHSLERVFPLHRIVSPDDIPIDTIAKHYPGTNLSHIITQMNDVYHWTFDEIAAWLEGIGF